MKAHVYSKCVLTTALCAVCLLGCDQTKPKVGGNPGATGDHHVYYLLSFDRKTGTKNTDWAGFEKIVDEVTTPFGELSYCERAKQKNDYCRGPKLFCKCVRGPLN